MMEKKIARPDGSQRQRQRDVVRVRIDVEMAAAQLPDVVAADIVAQIGIRHEAPHGIDAPGVRRQLHDRQVVGVEGRRVFQEVLRDEHILDDLGVAGGGIHIGRLIARRCQHHEGEGDKQHKRHGGLDPAAVHARLRPMAAASAMRMAPSSRSLPELAARK